MNFVYADLFLDLYLLKQINRLLQLVRGKTELLCLPDLKKLLADIITNNFFKSLTLYQKVFHNDDCKDTLSALYSSSVSSGMKENYYTVVCGNKNNSSVRVEA